MGLTLVVLRDEGPKRAVLRPTRASLQAIRGCFALCVGHFSLKYRHDEGFDSRGDWVEMLQVGGRNGSSLVDGCDCESLR